MYHEKSFSFCMCESTGSIAHNMIIVFKFPNGKCNLGDTKNLKLSSGESCERPHVKTKKTVTHCKRDRSQSVALSGYENLSEINLLQVQVPSQKNTRALQIALTAVWLLWSRDR